MTNPSKAKGDQFERQVRDLFIANGVTAERIPAGASGDLGDLWVPGLATVQCKNQRRIELGPWLDETVVQQERSGKPWHWLAVKRRGVTDPERQFAVCELAQAVWLMRELGS